MPFHSGKKKKKKACFLGENTLGIAQTRLPETRRSPELGPRILWGCPVRSAGSAGREGGGQRAAGVFKGAGLATRSVESNCICANSVRARWTLPVLTFLVPFTSRVHTEWPAAAARSQWWVTLCGDREGPSRAWRRRGLCPPLLTPESPAPACRVVLVVFLRVLESSLYTTRIRGGQYADGCEQTLCLCPYGARTQPETRLVSAPGSRTELLSPWGFLGVGGPFVLRR